jgi:hypothetical protein
MTNMNDELDADQLKIIERVEKLMRLATKNPNAEEAASAAAKAQELLVAYNLSAELVGNAGSSADAKREKQKIAGGMYQYQRELWYAVASLNFCLHFTRQERDDCVRIRKNWDGSRSKYTKTYWRHRHVIIGKRINARLTITMGQYLEQAIERLVKERYPLNSQRFLSEAVAFREGIADELYWRLLERRKALVAEEEARRNRSAQDAGYSVSQALTIGSLTQQEEDANYDVMYGEGWSAKQRAKRAERARVEAEADAAWTAWASAHPEEAAAEEVRRRKEAKRHAPRGGGPGSRGGQTGQQKRQSSSEYWQGRDVGKKVGLEPQTDDRREKTRTIS